MSEKTFRWTEIKIITQVIESRQGSCIKYFEILPTFLSTLSETCFEISSAQVGIVSQK